MIEFRSPERILLTPEEACRYLCLDQDRKANDPQAAALKALGRLVDRERLMPTFIAGRRRFCVRELDRFIEDKTEETPTQKELGP